MCNFYTRLNKELARIDQVITLGETIRDFVIELRPRGSSMYDNLNIILVNTVKEMGARVNSTVSEI